MSFFFLNAVPMSYLRGKILVNLKCFEGSWAETWDLEHSYYKYIGGERKIYLDILGR